MRQITAQAFPNDPNSWKFVTPDKLYHYSRAIVTEVLKKYHLPSLTDEVKERMTGLETDSETIKSIAGKTYSRNILADECPQEIKFAFLKISEILAISAYYYRTQHLSPLNVFTENTFAADVAGLITVLFELDDTIAEFQDLNILGTTHPFTGLPVLSEPLHIDFVTRWVNEALTPSVTDVKALTINQKDGFAFIPEIVKRAENLWGEYARHVFGKTADVVFKKLTK